MGLQSMSLLVACVRYAGCRQRFSMRSLRDTCRMYDTLTRRYAEAAAAAARIKELKAAEGERLKGLLASVHQAELAQLQDNFQQVLSLCGSPGALALVPQLLRQPGSVTGSAPDHVTMKVTCTDHRSIMLVTSTRVRTMCAVLPEHSMLTVLQNYSQSPRRCHAYAI